MTPEPRCPFPHGSFHRPIALEMPRCMCDALRAAHAKGRAAALEEAAREACLVVTEWVDSVSADAINTHLRQRVRSLLTPTAGEGK